MVEVFQATGGIARLTWTQVYGGQEPDHFHDAAISPAGPYMYRLRTDSSDNLLYQRITDPGPASPWQDWERWVTTACAAAICAPPAGLSVLAFRIGTDGHVYRRESGDYGNTWGNWTDMAYAGPAPASYRLAACHKSSTQAIVIYSDGVDLYRSRWSSGSGWEPFAKWTGSVHSVTGVAVSYLGDWNIVVTGEDSAEKPGVWTCVLGDGYSAAPGSWSSLKELTSAEKGSGTSFSFPSLNTATVPRAFFVEAFAGPEPSSRLHWTHSLATADFVDNLWREPVPFNQASGYGAAACYSNLHLWLSMPGSVWRGDVMPDHVDVTGDVVHIQAEARETSGGITIALRNDDGRFSSVGQPGSRYEPVKLGSEIRFSPGYVTAAGNEVSSGLAFWITGWEYVSAAPSPVSGPPSSVLRLHASDAWALLDGWKARRTHNWQAGNKNILQILSFIFARAGLELASVTSSSQLTSLKPALAIHPGESGRSAVLRLLSLVPDVIFFRGNYAYVKNPQAADNTDYTYELSATSHGHPIFEGQYAVEAKGANRVQVFGADLLTEDWDWAEIGLVLDRLAQVHDVNLDSAAKAHARGQAVLRDAAIHAGDGHILVPLNCGQELYDVVGITDQRAGLAGARRRVVGLTHTYAPAKGRYDLRIELGGV